MRLMLYRRLWRPCIVFFVQNPAAIVVKITYRLQHETLTNTTPLTRVLVCIQRSADIIGCRSSSRTVRRSTSVSAKHLCLSTRGYIRQCSLASVDMSARGCFANQ